MEAREEWRRLNNEYGSDLFVGCGMLRVQPSDHLGALERDTLASMERDGLRDSQFVKSSPEDCERATSRGWEAKLLDFAIPDDSDKTFDAVLDSLSGFVKCSEACAHLQKTASSLGVAFHLGGDQGTFDSFVYDGKTDKRRVIGVKTQDGVVHQADTAVVAGKSPHLAICAWLTMSVISWIVFNTDTA